MNRRNRERLSQTGTEDPLKVLLDIARVLTGTLRPEQLYPVIYEQSTRVLDSCGFLVCASDEDSGQARIVFRTPAAPRSDAPLNVVFDSLRPVAERKPMQLPADWPGFPMLPPAGSAPE